MMIAILASKGDVDMANAEEFLEVDSNFLHSIETKPLMRVLSDESEDSVAVVSYLIANNFQFEEVRFRGVMPDRPKLIYTGGSEPKHFVGRTAIAMFVSRPR